jgi:TRAP-type mannitol/chloroaromatic compound transport system permease large subunit
VRALAACNRPSDLLALQLPVPPAEAVTPALIGLLAATALGSPVFATLGGAALILFWGADLPIASIPLDHYRLVINPSLPTIPLFTLAGYFLAGWRLSAPGQGLSSPLRAVPRWTRDCYCFGLCVLYIVHRSFGVTILALGGLLMPMLLTAGYPPKSALGLLTGAGSLGLVSSMLAAHSVCDCRQNQY